MRVAAEVADRCRAATSGGERQVVGLSATLDVKMVSVASERVLWNYRNTRAMDLSKTDRALYFPAHESTYRRNRWPYVALAFGTVFGGIGLVVPEGSELRPVGLALGGSLIALGIAGLIFERHSTSWETPDQVICAAAAVPDPYAPAPVVVTPTKDPAKSRYELTESQRNRDPFAEYRLRLTHDLVADFANRLRDGTRVGNRE